MGALRVSDIMSNHIEPIRCGTPLTRVVKAPVSYTHLTLPTNREV